MYKQFYSANENTLPWESYLRDFLCHFSFSYKLLWSYLSLFILHNFNNSSCGCILAIVDILSMIILYVHLNWFLVGLSLYIPLSFWICHLSTNTLFNTGITRQRQRNIALILCLRKGPLQLSHGSFYTVFVQGSFSRVQ